MRAGRSCNPGDRPVHLTETWAKDTSAEGDSRVAGPRTQSSLPRLVERRNVVPKRRGEVRAFQLTWWLLATARKGAGECRVVTVDGS